MRDHGTDFPVERMAHVLGVSRSGYYAWLSRPESPRQKERRLLDVRVKAAFEENHRRYGSLKIRRALAAKGYAYGRGREQDCAAAAGWHLIARTLGVSDLSLDRIVESLDETTMEEARELAEQYSATLMKPTEDPAAESP